MNFRPIGSFLGSGPRPMMATPFRGSLLMGTVLNLSVAGLGMAAGLTVISGSTARNARAAEPIATFSIVGYDAETGELGVAVQSRAFSVGSAVPWAEAGIGAIATQSQTNESFGPMGLAKLCAGLSPPVDTWM